MDTSLAEFISKGGVVTMLIAAIYYVSNKLSAAYESRITALEKAKDVCEKDRIELRKMILRSLNHNISKHNNHEEE